MNSNFSAAENVCNIPFARLCRQNKTYRSYFIDKTYQPSQCIHSEGAPIEHFGIVVDGILKAVNDTINGVELCHTYFLAEDIFPELLYFTGARQYTYSLYAVKKAEVVWIPVNIMEEMMTDDPQLIYALLIYISHRGLKNQLFLNCLNYQTIRERVSFWIVGMHRITMGEAIQLPSSQSILANMLHVSRASLNQELKLMEREGYFQITHKEIRRVDLDRLSRLL